MAEGGYTSCKREIKGLPADNSVTFVDTYGLITCTRRWSGLAEAHCAACHRHFSNGNTFDLHRAGGKCLDPAKIKYEDGKKKGQPRLRLVTRASGPVWLFAEEKDMAAVLAGRGTGGQA